MLYASEYKIISDRAESRAPEPAKIEKPAIIAGFKFVPQTGIEPAPRFRRKGF